MIAIVVMLALLLDHYLGELPSKYHPLVYYGHCASQLERVLNMGKYRKAKGLFALLILLLPVFVLAIWFEQLLQLYPLVDVIVCSGILYIAIGWRSLLQHADNVQTPLAHQHLFKARQALSLIVSRDTEHLSEQQIASAATESVLENGADAIFAAIFWFCLLGLPGVLIYRLGNTLDAMWGYKNPRFINFGWAAARFDDVINSVPAQLTALSYALVGNTALAVKYWFKQGFSWKSPNAGSVMAAGAGALNVSLGGAASYHHQPQHRATLGPPLHVNSTASFNTIKQACQLVNKALLVWLLGIVLLVVVL